MRKIPHGWTKKTMGECAKRFMEDLQHYYYNFRGYYRDTNVKRLIDQYTLIESSVLRGLDYYEK